MITFSRETLRRLLEFRREAFLKMRYYGTAEKRLSQIHGGRDRSIHIYTKQWRQNRAR